MSLGGCWPRFRSLSMRRVLSLKRPGTTQPTAQSIADLTSLFFSSINKMLVTNSELSDYYIRVLKSERN